MITDMPTILNDLPIHWQGVDDSTPAGCTLVCTEVAGLPTTYVVRDGEVIGRVEVETDRQYGYVGHLLRGGRYIGRGDFYELAQKIADFPTGREGESA